jgi:hypothetical protein
LRDGARDERRIAQLQDLFIGREAGPEVGDLRTKGVELGTSNDVPYRTLFRFHVHRVFSPIAEGRCNLR